MIKTNKPYTLHIYYNDDAPPFPPCNSTLRWMASMFVCFWFYWKKTLPQKGKILILAKQMFHGVREKRNICVIKRERTMVHYLPFVQECKEVPNDHLASTHCKILHLRQSTHQTFRRCLSGTLKCTSSSSLVYTLYRTWTQIRNISKGTRNNAKFQHLYVRFNHKDVGRDRAWI